VTVEDLSAKRFRWHSSLVSLQRISTPFSFEKQYPLSVYASVEELRQIWVITLLVVILLNVAMLVISFSLAYAVGRYLHSRRLRGETLLWVFS
jgi:hypothetical protein